MREELFESIRQLPREELEELALRAALRRRVDMHEITAANDFTAVLIGFLFGAIVAASGFLIGLGLA